MRKSMEGRKAGDRERETETESKKQGQRMEMYKHPDNEKWTCTEPDTVEADKIQSKAKPT